MPPQYGYAGLPPAKVKRGLSRRSIIALCVLGGVILVLAIAGAVISKTLGPKHHTVSLPPTLLGVPQLHDADLDAEANQVAAGLTALGAKHAQVAYYGVDGLPDFAVITSDLRNDGSEQDAQAFFTGMSHSLGPDFTMNRVASGPFGGAMACGTTTTNGIQVGVCGSIDSSVAVEVIVFNADETDAENKTRQLISAVER